MTLTNPDHVEVEAIEVKLESLAAREKRLVTRFSYGESTSRCSAPGSRISVVSRSSWMIGSVHSDRLHVPSLR